MKKLFLVMLCLSMLAIMPGMAAADYTLSSAGTYWASPKPGDPSLAPYTGGVPTGFAFTSFDTYFSDTATFKGTGTIGYGGSFNLTDGWSGVILSDTKSRAMGGLTSTLKWDYSFAGTLKWPLVFDINYFNGSDFVGHEHYSISGQTYTGGFDKNQVVPLPPSILLLGSGLLGLVGLGWRKKAK